LAHARAGRALQDPHAARRRIAAADGVRPGALLRAARAPARGFFPASAGRPRRGLASGHRRLRRAVFGRAGYLARGLRGLVMLNIVLHFPAGRYHATPWGRHVNEGDVEWPPSPLRLLRALLAVGFNRLGWAAVPDVGRRLLEALSRVPPVFHLPPASAAHTR